MKHRLLLFVALVMATVASWAADVSPYQTTFDTPINTADPAFRVASNWKHIVGKYSDSYGDYYMTYSYQAEDGVEGSGALRAGEQRAGESYYDSETVTDLLVTPVVSGQVTLQVRRRSSSAFVELYALNDDASARGDRLYRIAGDELTDGEWQTVTFNVDAAQRIGIRAQFVDLDNFTAEHADITPEKSMTIASAEPSATSGMIHFEQQPDGSVLVKYTVTVTNTGDVALAPGDEGYSISVFDRASGNVLLTTPVPEALAVGQTSAPFDVAGPVAATAWPSGYPYYIYCDLRENLQGSVVQRAWSDYVAYASKYTFRLAGTTKALTSYAFGIVSEATTVQFEIANDGAAPLTIEGITVPAGFQMAETVTLPLTIAGQAVQTVTLTLPATPTGVAAGDLTILYKEYGADAQSTYTLSLSGNMVAPGTWIADFNNADDSKVVYPEGSIAEDGLNPDKTYHDGSYDYYLASYTSSSYAEADNRFITPLLHAEAGEAISFDAGRVKPGSTFFLKVYASKDRKTWGEPLASWTSDDLTTSLEMKSVTLPEGGNYYLAFAIFGTKLDNIVGLRKVDVDHDLYFRKVTQPTETQSGQEMSVSLEVLPLTNEAATGYTVAYTLGQKRYAIPSVDLTASARDRVTFDLTLTPEVPATVTLPAHFSIVLAGGDSIVSDAQQVTVTNEPEFYLINRGETVGRYAPTSRTQPLAFGITNKVGQQIALDIYNHGAAPLHVTAITLPEGFTASIENATVAPKQRAELDVTFAATEAGTYEGQLDITYLDAAQAEQHFLLPVSATLLDPTKWYTPVPEQDAPAGCTYEKNVQFTNNGTWSDPDYCINSTSTSANTFISPLLHAEAGEALQFDAKTYRSYWAEGAITVAYAQTREDLIDPAKRHDILTVSGESTDEATLLNADNYRNFQAVLPEAGDFYLGFVISGRAQLDNLYGLRLVDVPVDLQLAAASVPAEVMQNQPAQATLSVRNFGFTPVAGYTLTALVDGKPFQTIGTAEIDLTPRLNATPVDLAIPFRASTVGNVEVQLQLVSGDFTLTSEPVTITVTPEVASSEKQIGTFDDYNSAVPLYLYYKNSENVTLYTAADLGLADGAKINQLTYKGYSSGAFTSHVKVYYEWTDDTEQAQPATSDNYDASQMTLAFDKDYDWQAVGSYGDAQPMLTVTFPEPLVYVEGKSLRVFITSSADSYKGGFYFEQSTTTGRSYGHQNDGTAGVFDGSWSGKNSPVIYLGLEAESRTLTGTVTDEEGNAVSGATVTLTSTDGDGVAYTATTDQAGQYTLNVIQATRTYDALATYGLLTATAEGLTFDENQTQDFTLSAPTAISGVSADARRHTIYNVSGQRLNKAQRGVNIVDGRKVIY